jgi:hypothetical protein
VLISQPGKPYYAEAWQDCHASAHPLTGLPLSRALAIAKIIIAQ